MTEESNEDLRARRLKQLATIVTAALAATSLTSLIKGDYPTLAILGTAFVLSFIALVLARRGKATAAALTILWMLTPMTALVMWTNQGIYSPGILVYPVILVIAGMTVNLRHALSLLAFIVASLCAMSWASITGRHSFIVDPPTVGHLIYVLTILGAFGGTIFMLARDLWRALDRARTEARRVLESNEQLRYLAEHDQLTGMPNRRLGGLLFEQAVGLARRQAGQVGVMFVDLDNFKGVNDSFGHTAGDDLLRQAAERLRVAVRSSDVVIRQGSDEFLVLLPDAADGNAAASAAAHVLAAMNKPYKLGALTVAASCSIGVAMYPAEGSDFETLVKKADLAMHHAKDAGRNAIRFFDAAMNADMLEDLNLNTSLALALERDELSLHYQALLDLESGQLIGAEGLLRWQHPERGQIPPGRFIPIAERSGLIVDIGQWVIDEACRQLKLWQDSGLGHLVLSVNVSTVQFKRGNIDLVVSHALEKHGIPPSCLELEVTESALIHDAETFVATLHRLKDLGVRLAIDDFGTGYSNLSYLQRFEVDKLKIDQSFVRRLTDKEQDQAIVRAIVQMAKSLKLKTTAEGIEEEATAVMLKALGCDQGQGYFYSRPVPLAQFEELARR